MDIIISLSEKEEAAIIEQLAQPGLVPLAEDFVPPTPEEWVRVNVASLVKQCVIGQKQRNLGTIDYTKLSDKQVTDIKAILSE